MRRTVSALITLSTTLLMACSGGHSDKGNTSSFNAPPIIQIPNFLQASNVLQIKENNLDPIWMIDVSDPDGDPVHLSLGGADASAFSLDILTNTLHFVAPPDYELPLDADKNNRYELTIIASDNRGASNAFSFTVEVENVSFDYRIISPLPNSLVEFERYSRLPIAVWVEYDFSEKFQLLINDEIMNPDSDSRATWTGSISLPEGKVDAEFVFWRGDTILEKKTIPIRHQHIISQTRHGFLDTLHNRVILPHPQRLEALSIDISTGKTQKHYPWTGTPPDIRDITFDTTSGSAVYVTSNGIYRFDPSTFSTYALPSDLNQIFKEKSIGSIALDINNDRLWILGEESSTHYYAYDFMTSMTSTYTTPTELESKGAAHLAVHSQKQQLLLVSKNGNGVNIIDIKSQNLLQHFPLKLGKNAQPAQIEAIEMVEELNQIFLFDSNNKSLYALNLDNGQYHTLSGVDALQNHKLKGSGESLQLTASLMYDAKNQQLIAADSARLLAINPQNGNRSILLDSSAGNQNLPSSYLATWVSPRATYALGLHIQGGKYTHIDLSTGEKTEKRYREDQASERFDATLIQGKFDRSGRYAAIKAKNPDETIVLRILDLNSGFAHNLTQESSEQRLIDFHFSQPENHLVALWQHHNPTSTYYTLQKWPGNPLTSTPNTLKLPAASQPIYHPLAIQQINDQWFLLERLKENPYTDAFFQLSTLDTSLNRTPLFSVPDYGKDTAFGFSLDALFNDSVIAVVLPEQPTRFWDIKNNRESTMDFSSFNGSDQARHFQSIHDFNEAYFATTHAGLHLCWRFHCTVLSN